MTKYKIQNTKYKAFLGAVFLCVFLSSKGAFAQNEQAESLFRAAEIEYMAERYKEAIKIFTLVYKLEPQAEALGYIAISHARLGHYSDAISYVETMLSAFSLEELGDLYEKAHARNIAYRLRLRVEDSASRAAEIRAVERERLREASKRIERWSWMGWIGAGTVLVGGGGIATAVLMDPETQRLDTELRNINDAKEVAIKNETLNNRRRNQSIALFGGIGLVAIGTTLIVWDLTTTKEVYDLEFTFDGRNAGASVTWKF